jgi:hypothetical protein
VRVEYAVINVQLQRNSIRGDFEWSGKRRLTEWGSGKVALAMMAVRP